MKNLKIWQKLLLLAAVFTLPFLIVTATLLFARGELVGGGASTMPVRGGQPTDLLAVADGALYQAKNDGKNRAVLREMDVPQDSPADA